MGYSIYQLKTEFFIPKKFKSEALFSIKKLAEDFSGSGRQIAFARISEFEQSEILEEALSALRWAPDIDETGNIIDIEFTGEKLGDDYDIFNSIAGYVKTGSFITLIGDDSKLWRWLFLNGRVVEQKGVLAFED